MLSCVRWFLPATAMMLVLGCGSDGGGEAGDIPPAQMTEPAPVRAGSLSTTAGDAMLTVQWEAGSSSDSFTLYYKDSEFDASQHPSDEFDSQAPGLQRITGITASPYEVMGLINGTRYYIKVTAVNSVGESDAIDVVSAVPAAPIIFGAPENVVAESGNRRVTLSWGPVMDVDSYQVYYAPQSLAGDPENWDEFNGGTVQVSSGGGAVPQTSVTIANLDNGVRYYFLVTATSSHGLGESDPSVEASVEPDVQACLCTGPACVNEVN